MSVQSVCGKHMSYFYVGITDKSRGQESSAMPIMCSPFTDRIAGDHIKTSNTSWQFLSYTTLYLNMCIGIVSCKFDL